MEGARIKIKVYGKWPQTLQGIDNQFNKLHPEKRNLPIYKKNLFTLNLWRSVLLKAELLLIFYYLRRATLATWFLASFKEQTHKKYYSWCCSKTSHWLFLLQPTYRNLQFKILPRLSFTTLWASHTRRLVELWLQAFVLKKTENG